MKFTALVTPAGTHVGQRELFLDVANVEAVFPCISADPDIELTEIRMGNGREYVVIGKPLDIAVLIDTELRKP